MKIYSKENDPFLNTDNAIKRLIDEWNNYGILVIAFDFDNTIFDYYGIGVDFPKVSTLLRECKALGAHIICFTSCNEDRIPEIVKYLEQKNIPYDSINESPDFIPFKGRKVYYNILLDDRAGLRESYETLKSVSILRRIEKHSKKGKNSQDIDM